MSNVRFNMGLRYCILLFFLTHGLEIDPLLSSFLFFFPAKDLQASVWVLWLGLVIRWFRGLFLGVLRRWRKSNFRTCSCSWIMFMFPAKGFNKRVMDEGSRCWILSRFFYPDIVEAFSFPNLSGSPLVFKANLPWFCKQLDVKTSFDFSRVFQFLDKLGSNLSMTWANRWVSLPNCAWLSGVTNYWLGPGYSFTTFSIKDLPEP